MAIAKRVAWQGGGTGLGGTAAWFANTVALNDFMVFVVELDCHTSGVMQVASVSDNLGNTWTMRASAQSTLSGHQQRTELWTARNASSSVPTVTIGVSGAVTAWSATGLAFSGVDTTTPISNAAQVASNFGASAALYISNFPTWVNDAMVVACMGSNSASVNINSAGYTSSGATNSSGSLAATSMHYQSFPSKGVTDIDYGVPAYVSIFAIALNPVGGVPVAPSNSIALASTSTVRFPSGAKTTAQSATINMPAQSVAVCVVRRFVPTAATPTDTFTDSTGKTWTRKSRVTTATGYWVEAWWTYFPTAATGVVATINSSVSFTYCTMDMFAVTGVRDFNNPWDRNGAALNSSSGTASGIVTAGNVSTNSSDTLQLVGLVGEDASASPADNHAVPIGFTMVGVQDNNGNGSGVIGNTGYRKNAGALTNQTPTWVGGSAGTSRWVALNVTLYGDAPDIELYDQQLVIASGTGTSLASPATAVRYPGDFIVVIVATVGTSPVDATNGPAITGITNNKGLTFTKEMESAPPNMNGDSTHNFASRWAVYWAFAPAAYTDLVVTASFASALASIVLVDTFSNVSNVAAPIANYASGGVSNTAPRQPNGNVRLSGPPFLAFSGTLAIKSYELLVSLIRDTSAVPVAPAGYSSNNVGPTNTWRVNLGRKQNFANDAGGSRTWTLSSGTQSSSSFEISVFIDGDPYVAPLNVRPIFCMIQ